MPYLDLADMAGLLQKNLWKTERRYLQLTPQEIRKVALWIDLLVPFIGDYREANNWSQKDLDFYNYYDKKREAARAEDQENIRQYIQSLQTKQEKK